MSKLFGIIALTGLMSLGVAAASQAQVSFTLTQPTGTLGVPADADSFLSGVTTNGGTFTAFLGTVPSQSFAGASSVSFGTTSQLGPAGADAYTNVAANFTFDLTVPNVSITPNATKSFQVRGVINGTTSFNAITNSGASNAFFSPVTVLVDGTSMALISTISPAGRQSLELANLDFGGGKIVDVFFDQLNALTAPGGTSPLSVGGFVRARVVNVPEPGSVAMLVGMGISGSVFIRRRKNVRKTA